MPRLHILSSWVGAAEYDEGDTYSGEQVGRRSQKSIGVTIERDGDQWKGRVATGYNTRTTRAKKPAENVLHSINCHAAKLDKLDQQEKRLYDAFMSDEIDAEQYESSYYTLCMQREKTYKAYMKSIGKEKEWQRQNAEQLAEYRKQDEKPSNSNDWQAVTSSIGDAVKWLYTGMAGALVLLMQKQLAYANTKQEFEGENTCIVTALVVCATLVAFQTGRML